MSRVNEVRGGCSRRIVTLPALGNNHPRVLP
jgi:hypothetical protein